jgi:hypothetical protein
LWTAVFKTGLLWRATLDFAYQGSADGNRCLGVVSRWDPYTPKLALSCIPVGEPQPSRLWVVSDASGVIRGDDLQVPRANVFLECGRSVNTVFIGSFTAYDYWYAGQHDFKNRDG